MHALTAFPEDEGKDKKKDKDKDEDEMSAEDKALQEGLELAVTRAQESDPGVQRMALEHLRTEIRAATSSMTSVPKPLKFLRPHYATLKTVRAPNGFACVGDDTRVGGHKPGSWVVGGSYLERAQTHPH
jgi:hypothetical protein